MKICNLILSLNKGGAENVTSILSNYWSNYHDVSIVLLVDKKKWPPSYKIKKKIKIFDLKLFNNSKNIFHAIKKNFLRIKKIRSTLKKINPDIIIAHCSREIVLTFFSTIFLRKKIIGYLHSHPKLVKEKSFVWRFLSYISLSFINHCVIFSKSSLKYLPFFSKKKALIISNVSSESFLNKYNLNLSNNNIIMVGSFIEIKNHIFAINAFNLLKHKFPNWTLTIVGEGKNKNIYKNFIKKNNLTKKVFLKNYTKNVFQLFSKSSIFLLPSKSEGLSLSLLEAIKFGLPSIISNCSEAQNEIFTNKYNAIIYDKNNINELVKSMNMLMSSKKKRENISNNLKKIINKFANKNILKNWNRILFYK